MLASQRAVRETSRSSIPPEQARLISFPNVPPERSVQRLTRGHIERPWTSCRLGRLVSSLGARLGRKMRAAARIAGPVIILCALPGFASAQDAEWNGPGADWNTPANWLTTTVPGPNGTATFGRGFSEVDFYGRGQRGCRRGCHRYPSIQCADLYLRCRGGIDRGGSDNQRQRRQRRSRKCADVQCHRYSRTFNPRDDVQGH